MKIGVDIDGVMYQWDKTARYLLREVLPNSPYNLPGGALASDSHHWNYIQDHVSEEHWHWLWTEGVRHGLFRHGHLYSGTIQAINQLAEIGEVIAITHRPKSAVHDTLAWLAYQNLPLSGLHILVDLQSKSSVPYCDAYIDDKPENVADLFENTPAELVALMNRPWNFNFQWHTRVYTWDAFVTLVRENA